MKKVSVIVPFYNVENYIEKCLKSLVNQTLQDIEIIIVNDGSKDNSYKIAKKYSEKYPDKIKYFEKPNGGLGDARNYGINYATGEYIAFLDSDDYVEKEMYQEMYEKAKKENADMCECDFLWEYPDKIRQDIGKEYKNINDMIINSRVVAWNKLIKREIYFKNPNSRFSVGLRYEDIEGFYKIAPFIKKVAYVRKCFIHYIQRNGSISNTQNKRDGEIFDVLDNVINFYKENDIYEKYKKELEYLYTRYLLCSSFLRIVKIKDKSIKKELLDKTWENLNEKFPNWRANEILKEKGNKKKMYMRSVNKLTFKIYSYIFR